MRSSRASIVIVGALAASLLAAGCAGSGEASGGSGGSGSGGGGSTVKVVLKDFTVEPEVTSAKAGTVTFELTNQGATVHALTVVKTDLDPGKLPTTEVGGVPAVDTKASGLEVLGEKPSIVAGASDSLTVTLQPGRYVLVCNIPNHYTQGMHAAFTVS